MGCQLHLHSRWRELFLNLEHQLPSLSFPRLGIKTETEGLFEELGKERRKFSAFRYDFDGIVSEAVAEQQNSEALRQSAAPRLRERAADFCLRGSGKGAHGTTFFFTRF